MRQLHEINQAILSVLKGGDILFIVPPFTTIQSPVPGVHILQSFAEEQGYKAEVLYLNVLLASVIGVERSEYISSPPFEGSWRMLGERLFARSAYGLPPLGKSPEYCSDEAMSVSGSKQHHTMFYESEVFDLEEYLEIEKICYAFVDAVIPAIASLNYKMMGCTTRIGQTNCCIVLLNGIKRLCPEMLTLIGGANCEDEMAQGIASLSESIDYVFSGESELSFYDFLKSYSNSELPSERIIWGKPLMDLDSLALPDYRCFFEQIQGFLGENSPKQLAVSYETSRGCWWGAKRKCRFCSNQVMYREKTAPKVLNDLKQLSQRYPNKAIYMCDNIMPISFLKDLFSARKEKEEFPPIYYMSKANLKLKDLINLKTLKVEQITSGIEAISTGLLKLMSKGVTARQNLQLLRNARSLGIHLDWLLLWGFPGDKTGYYQETLNLLPLIRHLQPPESFAHLFLARFSPYLEKAQDFQISNMRPWTVYRTIYPEWVVVDKLAYWFVGKYPCEAHEYPQLIKKITEEVALWKKVWETTYLVMVPFQENYLILDNRDNNGKKQHVVDYHEAKEIMTVARYNESEYQTWAVEEKLGVLVDSWYVPLVTASAELLLQFEE